MVVLGELVGEMVVVMGVIMTVVVVAVVDIALPHQPHLLPMLRHQPLLVGMALKKGLNMLDQPLTNLTNSTKFIV